MRLDSETQFQIKRYEKQDLGLVKEFYEKSFQGDIERKIEAFRWIAENNPFKDPQNTYTLIVKNDKIIGYHGIMPMRFYLNGEPFIAVFGQEMLINPSFRGQGLATILVKESKLSNSFHIGLWFNEKLLSILQKERVNIGHFRPLKKIFNIDNLFQLKFKKWNKIKLIRNILLALTRRYYRSNNVKNCEGEQCHVETIKRFDNEYDIFFLNIVKKFKFISDRTSQTLNWKYIDISYRKFNAFCARKDNKIAGYIILAIEEQEYNIKRGIIADLLIDPSEINVLESLLSISDQIFIENKVDFSVCQISSSFFRSVMKKHGYHQSKKIKCDCILINNERYSPNPKIVTDIDNYYFTYGDSDYLMW